MSDMGTGFIDFSRHTLLDSLPGEKDVERIGRAKIWETFFLTLYINFKSAT